MLDQNQFRAKLETEKNLLLIELQDLEHPDQEAVPEFKDETAEKLEAQEDREATATTLKTRLNEVRLAFERLDQGIYGQCLVCHKEIETERLEANPAATTCKQHLK